jgi:integrase
MVGDEGSSSILKCGSVSLCEHPRRNWPKCGCSWHFNFKPKGGPSYRFSVDSEVGKHIEAKGDAEALADEWRSAIRTGKFRRRSEQIDTVPADMLPSQPNGTTVDAFIQKYIERRVEPISSNDRGCLRGFARFTLDGVPVGDRAIGSLTEDDVEAFFSSLVKADLAASTRNKFVQAIKAALRWAAKKGYITSNPIAESDNIKREKHARRDRRLVADVLDKNGQIAQDGEERRLLAVAAPRLQRLIIGAVETCCRRGELLALQWRDVSLSRRELVVRTEEEGAKKTGEGRQFPISSRLWAVLDMMRTETENVLRSAHADANDAEITALMARWYVFGDEAGQKLGNFKRAWETAVLKAHGHTPQWTKKTKALTPEARAVLDQIDLHFHDLRHEGASRLLEAGWPLHHVQGMLGHANLSQTSTYLNATRIGMHESMRRSDESPSRCNPIANGTQTDLPPVRNHEQASDSEVTVN